MPSINSVRVLRHNSIRNFMVGFQHANTCSDRMCHENSCSKYTQFSMKFNVNDFSGLNVSYFTLKDAREEMAMTDAKCASRSVL